MSCPRAYERRYLGLLAALVLAAGAGCGGDDDDDTAGPRDDYGGLVASARTAPAPLDAERASRRPAALVRAARASHVQVGEALGPHRATATSKLTIDADGAQADGDGEPLEQLETRVELSFAGPERFRAVLENSADYGREVIYADDVLYLRPRYGRFHRRAPSDPGEPARIRDHVFAELGDHVALFAPALAVSDGGITEHEGRPARRVTLSLAEEPRAPAPGLLPQQAWRTGLGFESVRGEIVLDAATGVPLSATLEGSARFEREGRPLRMHVVVEHRVEPLAAAPTVDAPEEWVATPLSSHEHEEREALLEGIAQPARPAPTPARAEETR
ncbi:hypothetical protein [Haliangium sp.]|uniref:hypothetical protein n=1 Tax=Haliangium sp. TaxID=2663208 RepID=UPI003D10C3F9